MNTQNTIDAFTAWPRLLRTLDHGSANLAPGHVTAQPKISAKVGMPFCGLTGMTTGAHQPMKGGVESVHMLEASGQKAPLKQHTATQPATHA